MIARDPDYPPSAVYAHALPLYFRGVHDDVPALLHPEHLEARTRNFARIGGLFSDRRIAAMCARLASLHSSPMLVRRSTPNE